MHGIDTIIHLAANMGGMGTIHERNDFQIFRENNAMTLNILEAAAAANVRLVVLASSACVYPDHLQQATETAVRLRESDVWDRPPPITQALYGLEKLVGELLARNASLGQTRVRIARFHNVYGPGGAWTGGREKAPAAFSRKALALKKLGREPVFEMWGTGEQQRSFLFIDDCVHAVRLLLKTEISDPVNIGSEDAVTMAELARMAASIAGLDDTAVRFTIVDNGPVGVAARSSDNSFVESVLAWTPRVGLEEGMRRTVEWIEAQPEMKSATPMQLEGWTKSSVLNLLPVTFAVLLPITSRGAQGPEHCIENLQKFSTSLARTTWRDTHQLGGRRFQVRVYVVLDRDDTFLASGVAEKALREEGLMDVRTMVRDYPPGSICALWRDAARQAWEDGGDYFLLLGDDVELLDEGWMRDIDARFQQVNPPGFGCIAFTDVSFPGMPTFPVIHRTHMDIFGGEVIPAAFLNQDGDPFLFQLYRRFGASAMVQHLRIKNGIGGSDSPRYERKHVSNWTFDILDNATVAIEAWLQDSEINRPRLLTLDVIVPSYRVPLDDLHHILALQSTSTMSVNFIVIVDDPSSPNVALLEHRHGHRVDVRIRVNSTNLGASETRNRGLRESAAEWVHFLDDDVVPRDDILIEAERVIREHPRSAGFVATVHFPPADTIFKTAIHLAGVTYFWDIAEKMPSHTDLPWGVTASLIARRNRFNVVFEKCYPKTGGGEDVHFCLDKRDRFVNGGLEGFRPAPLVVATHPYWSDGKRSYSRFSGWSIGDGHLVVRFPQHTYVNMYPTSAEHLAFLIVAAMGSLALGQSNFFAWLMPLAALALVTNVVHDLFNHIILERTADSRSTIGLLAWPFAVVESTFIRIWSETGRLRGQMQRGELTIATYGRRFDWFVGRVGTGPIEHDRRLSFRRFWLWVFVAIVFMICT